MKLDPTSLKRLTIAKYLYLGAADGLRSAHPLTAAEALLRVHDAVEMFQLVVFDVVGISSKFEFMKFWEEVKLKTSNEPPYKDRMGRLNHMRVGFKHKGVLPDLSEVREIADIVGPFFADVCREYLELDFATVNLSELVEDADVRGHLGKAATLIGSENHEDALKEVAIAFYLIAGRGLNWASWGPRATWVLGDELSRDWPREIPFGRYFGGINGASSLIEQLDEHSRDMRGRISAIAQILVMLMWKIDPKEHAQFSQLMPSVSRYAGGEFRVIKRMGPLRPVTARDARFCFKFALDAALVVERQRREVPDIYGGADDQDFDQSDILHL